MEGIFNTPSHHRVHHGMNHQYLDKNYAGILIIWDRLFGTWEPEGERVRYGLTKQLETFHPVRVAFHEYIALAHDVRHTRGVKRKAEVLLRGPGWAPRPRRRRHRARPSRRHAPKVRVDQPDVIVGTCASPLALCDAAEAHV